MTITDGEKAVTLEELAQRLCSGYDECDADGCPAATICRRDRNGMLAWLREVLDDLNGITYETRQAVYKAAIAQNGAQLQAVVALEELSEAQKEICKWLRGGGNMDHLAEEIADALIMLEQMQTIFHINESVCRWIDTKVQRLADRLNGGEKECT